MISPPYPTKRQAKRALLIAPLLPVGILFLLDAIDRAIHIGLLAIVGAAMLALYMLIVVEVFAVVLGGAALAALWKRIPLNPIICAIIGGLVASLPFLVFGLVSALQEPIHYDAWIDGKATVVSGVKTSFGHWQDFLAILQIFGLGAIGGAFFWWLCRSPEPADLEAE